MDSSSLIITIILLVLAAAPFVYFAVRKNMRNNKFKALINEYAAQNNSNPENYDFWNTCAIGIDNKNHSLVYVRKTDKNEYIKHFVNLKEVQRARLIETEKNVGADGTTTRILARLDVAISFTDKNKSDETLEFYNVDYDGYIQTNELELAKKWINVINEFIGKKK